MGDFNGYSHSRSNRYKVFWLGNGEWGIEKVDFIERVNKLWRRDRIGRSNHLQADAAIRSRQHSLAIAQSS